jgi:hypothetical protein
MKMYDTDKFESLDYSITQYRFTQREASNHLNISEEWIELAIEDGEFDDILEYKGEKYIHMDDIKDFVLYGGVQKMKKRWEDLGNE